MPSVIEAARNSAAASNSFSPFTLEKRLVDSTQISTGMLRMRMSVMELGKFTVTGGVRAGMPRFDYPPRELRTQWRVERRGGRFPTRRTFRPHRNGRNSLVSILHDTSTTVSRLADGHRRRTHDPTFSRNCPVRYWDDFRSRSAIPSRQLSVEDDSQPRRSRHFRALGRKRTSGGTASWICGKQRLVG